MPSNPILTDLFQTTSVTYLMTDFEKGLMLKNYFEISSLSIRKLF